MSQSKNKTGLGEKKPGSTVWGVVFVVLSLYFAFAYLSYFFTWNEDQSILNSEGWRALINQTPVANPTGRLGALITHFLFIKSFGVISILIVLPMFAWGVNNLFQKRVFKFYKILFYTCLCVFYFSTLLGLLFFMPNFPLSGAVGEIIAEWLKGFIGTAGSILVFFGVPLIYVLNRQGWLSMLPSKSLVFFSAIKNLIPYRKKEKPDVETATINIPEQPTQEELFLSDRSELQSKQEREEDKILNVKSNPEEWGFNPDFSSKKYQNIEFEIFEASESEEPLTPVTPPPPAILDNERVAEQEKIEESPFVPTKEEVFVLGDRIKPSNYAATDLATPDGEDIIENAEGVQKSGVSFEVVDQPATPTTYIGGQANHVNFVNILSPKKGVEETFELKNFEDPTLSLSEFVVPLAYHKREELLLLHGNENIVTDTEELQKNKDQIITTLRNYDISIDKIRATIGPTITLYEIVPSAGVRISKIRNLEDDIALSLAALGIRIIAPIPGKGTIGIEVPNIKKSIVSMKTLLNSNEFKETKYALPIALGKTIDNQNYIVDLATMPHLLMAGATGQGKSVGINAILVSLLWKKHPSQLKFVLVDPKKVELNVYKDIENHYLAKLPNEEDAIITDTKKVVNTLNALCIEMDSRYDLLKNAGARNIKEYNEKYLSNKLNPEHGHQYLPFIVLVIDEFADLIMTAGKEVETPIARLAQLARAIGIHLIIATQRPSVNIITGIIKANFPVRIAFKVSSKIDSRTILDAGGADQLIGKGDMLISHNGDLIRLQCAFVDTPEVENVVRFIGSQKGFDSAFLLPEYVDPKDLDNMALEFESSDHDTNLEDAARLIVQKQLASTSLIQRSLKLGYNRAGRIMDQLEHLGIVGPTQGSKPRELKIKTETQLNDILNQFR